MNTVLPVTSCQSHEGMSWWAWASSRRTCLHRHERPPDGRGGAVEETGDEVAQDEHDISPVAADVNH